jgi:hypothetical protein
MRDMITVFVLTETILGKEHTTMDSVPEKAEDAQWWEGLDMFDTFKGIYRNKKTAYDAAKKIGLKQFKVTNYKVIL